MKDKKPLKPREAKYRGTEIIDPVLGELVSRAIGSAYVSKDKVSRSFPSEMDMIIKKLRKCKDPEKILAALERAGLDELVLSGGKDEG